jgi:hypothetical protein
VCSKMVPLAEACSCEPSAISGQLSAFSSFFRGSEL